MNHTTRPDVRRDPGHDAGPLARIVPRDRLPLPAVALYALGAAAVGIALLGELLAATLGTPAVPAPTAFVAVGAVVALAALAGRATARLDWPIGSLVRLLEYGGILVLAAGADDTGRSLIWAFALLATLAVRHYDIVYRVRLLGSPPPGWLAAVTGGWSGRLAVLLLAATVGSVPVTIAVMTVVLAPIIVVEIVVSWTRRDA